jgi:hypothetical protein
MSDEQFYINYSLNGEHYAMGPYHTRRAPLRALC